MLNQTPPTKLRLALVLSTLCLSAFLCARGATYLLASALLPERSESVKASSRVRSGGVEQAAPQQLAQALLSRNIFDSDTGSMPWDAARAESPPLAGGVEVRSELEGDPAPCTAPLRLVGSLVVPPEPTRSLASIAASGKTTQYRTGMQVEGHELVGIREHRVFMRPSGRPLCQLAMFRPPEPQTTPTGDGSVEPTHSALMHGVPSEQELARGITQVSDGRYRVERSLIDKALGSHSELLKTARMVPHEESGRVLGMKVYGMRRSSLFSHLGLQNGDVLQAINGIELSSPDATLEAYAQLYQKNQLTLTISRRGQSRTFDYAIVGGSLAQ